MNGDCNRWNRPLQLSGLLLIAVLTIGVEAGSSTVGRPADSTCWWEDGCHSCRNLLSGCVTWYCPIPDPRGVGIVCPKDD